MKSQLRFILLIFTLLAAKSALSQLHFESVSHDFGTFGEADGKVSCTFRAVNNSRKPLIIRNIATSCGCTVPEFQRSPILPGDSTTVRVTYDPYGRPGIFDRKLYVWGTAEKPMAVLEIKGTVTPRQKSIAERYPIEAAGGIRLSATHCAYTYIYIGAEMQSAIGITNTSDKARTLRLEPITESGLMTLHYPPSLQPNITESINFTYKNPSEAPRYGTIQDSYRLYIDNEPTQIILMAHGVGIDKPAKMGKEGAPEVQLSENIIKFGAVKRANSPLERRLTITNSGSGVLYLRTVECSKGVQAQFETGTAIGPKQSLTGVVRLTLSPSQAGFVSEYLTLVTNDAARPMRRIRVTAIIEE